MKKARIFRRQSERLWFRLKPNPGLQLGRFHWCAFGGMGDRKKLAKLAKNRGA